MAPEELFRENLSEEHRRQLSHISRRYHIHGKALIVLGDKGLLHENTEEY